MWISANKLLPSLDVSQYKHVPLGLVFIKYISDAFDLRHADLGDGDSHVYLTEIAAEIEIRDYYLETNAFWISLAAR